MSGQRWDGQSLAIPTVQMACQAYGGDRTRANFEHVLQCSTVRSSWMRCTQRVWRGWARAVAGGRGRRVRPAGTTTFSPAGTA